MEDQRVGPIALAGDHAARGHVEPNGAAEAMADQFSNLGGDGAQTRGERSLGKSANLSSADDLPNLGRSSPETLQNVDQTIVRRPLPDSSAFRDAEPTALRKGKSSAFALRASGL